MSIVSLLLRNVVVLKLNILNMKLTSRNVVIGFNTKLGTEYYSLK